MTRLTQPSTRRAAVAICLTYWLSLLLPFALSYPADAGTSAGKVPICGAYGIVWVDADALGVDVPGAKQESAPSMQMMNGCGLCVLQQYHSASDLPPPITMALLAARMAWRVAVNRSSATQPALTARVQHLTRAPPLV